MPMSRIGQTRFLDIGLEVRLKREVFPNANAGWWMISDYFNDILPHEPSDVWQASYSPIRVTMLTWTELDVDWWIEPAPYYTLAFNAL